MPDPRRQTCKLSKGGCGKKAIEVGGISWRGLCLPCAKRKTVANMDQLHEMNGDAVLRWRRAVAASVGAVLLDDLPPSP